MQRNKNQSYIREGEKLPMFNDYPDVLTIDELQSALGIGRSMAYRLIRHGDIRHLRIGKNIKIPRRCLVDYIETACYNNATATGESIQSKEGAPS